MGKEKHNDPIKLRGSRMGKVLYFSGMGFRMIAIIGMFTFIGYKIDEGRNSELPLFTAGFSLIGVGIALYTVIKQVLDK